LGRAIILVRHAMPDPVPGVSPRLWSLADPAAEDCVLLAHALPEDLAPTIWSSTEKKAEQTAAIVAMRRGLATATDARFGEVDRPDEWVDDHRARAAAYLSGTEHPGWEPHRLVVHRFAEAVEAAQATIHREDDLIIVTHGMAMSLYLELVARIDIVPFWQALTFPDAWRIDLETEEATRVFGGATPAGG
jgi:broad specificity phosphatase PhoE